MKYRDGDLPQLPRRPALLDNNQQDYASQLNKALGLQVRPPGHIEATVGVGIQLDDWTRPEYQVLRGSRLFVVRGAVAAVAGQFQMVQFIANTPDSLIVLESMTVMNTNGAAMQITYGWGGFDGGITAAPEARDSRIYGSASSAYVTAQSAAAPTAPTPNGGFLQLGVNAIETVPLNWVICNPSKGFATSPVFKVMPTAVNQNLQVVIFYRERRILQTEIS
jgi:hypothetical protein